MKNLKNLIKNDLDFITRIGSGDANALKLFFDQYTPHFLYKVEKFIKGYCKNSAREYSCSLYLLKKKSNAQLIDDKRFQCGECIDSYVWFCNYFKKKVLLYKGKSRLENYIWSLLNSKNLFIDWLRWKYGRIDFQEDRLPSCIKDLSEQEKQIFILLRRHKSVSQIAETIDTTLTETEEVVHKIKELLIREGKLDLVQPTVIISIFGYGEDGEEKEIAIPAKGLEGAEKLILNDFLLRLREAISELPPDKKRILTLRYGTCMTPNEILEFLKNETVSLFKDKKALTIQLADIYNLLNSAINSILIILKNKANKRKERFCLDIKELKTILEEINI